MNSGRATNLRKILLNKTPEVLMLLRNEYGERTQQMSPQAVWRSFKRLYKAGKVPPSLLTKK